MARRHGVLIFTAGLTPWRDGQLIATGPIDGSVDASQVVELFQQIMSDAHVAVSGVLDEGEAVEAVIQMVVYVDYTPHARSLPQVADAAVPALEDSFGIEFDGVRTTVGAELLQGASPLEVQLTLTASC